MPAAEKSKGLPLGYKDGKLRPFFSSKVNPGLQAQTKFGPEDRFYLFVIISCAFLVRFYKLPEPPMVVFDETHFGGFAKEYFEGEFFLDVHPPLVKLIYYWIALLFGWNGKFEFENIGDVFDDNVPYVAMRSFSAACGVMTVGLTYCILRASACRRLVALFGASLVLLENSIATQSRLIMLDSPLIAFTALTVFAFKKFEMSSPFTREWKQWLFLTGIGLAFTVSTKLTGLFTFAWVAGWSMYQLWCYAGDLDVTYKMLFRHIYHRLFRLVLIPFTIYCGVFSLHFMSLPKNGTGSGILSPQFKAEFEDSDKLRNTAVDVSYGSTVTIKHHRLEQYLHSHEYPYKTGSHEQQVTMYGFQDDLNSEWIIERHGTIMEGQLDSRFRPIKDGDTVKLYHKRTKKYLRANDVRPPISEHDYSNEVSCDGNRTTTQDVNYEWKVRIVGRKPHSENELPLRKLRATESVFQLIHKGTRCILMGHDTKLPEWAFHQSQVLCVNDPTIANTLFYIEYNNHPVIDKDTETYPRVKLPRKSFFSKLLEYHQAMWRINKGFTTKHDYSSQPIQWPFVTRGINYFTNGHGDKQLSDETGSHIYFLGNVAVYYGGILVVLLFGIRFAFYALVHLNPFKLVNEPAFVTNNYITMLEFVSGWFINYFPYFHMSRQLFAHHYLVSVFFLALAIAQFVEHQMRMHPMGGFVLLLSIQACVALCFGKTKPLIYGSSWTVEECQKAKWFPTWDFDCMAYSQ
ncbi:putative dolichyl-phosphate-mannose- mannosyltransferase [Clavispora lusitaniae]|uniref:Dolichyl-phosphate-mannose-mannosyltransferase n=1 Tax=Clavispora lusitaniae TaxID=36911 RepID=A0ACD0WL02_CLALS|nr:hypothetical protein E0198_003004 [Clavispora lusitaniae]QFZ28125.1 putative dolichyl-phosphate-mannose- mannosyltransferase [Clavispora lusitaniae]QFZ33788.1 putative dolichyl-phosphate-mannose- mannosyltransferase [Clavispora lusitaniae]QFZ39472.1 putative dolichyl-phosphate-mannose- mannosyltransferase [Clavispora lusitaniae]QFZ45154.1 putative dolichyl-phosphate-mannose- mannosyltransferase [Clavispora lusitaniae]